MLTVEQVKPLLLHPLSRIRELVATALKDRPTRDPSLVVLVAEAVEKFGLGEASRLFTSVPIWPTTSAAENALWFIWERAGDDRINPQHPEMLPIRSFLAKGLSRASSSFLNQHETELRAAQSRYPKMEGFWETVETVERWNGLEPTDWWNELNKLAEVWDNQDHIPSDYGKRRDEWLIDSLAASDWLTDEQLLEKLKNYEELSFDEGWSGWIHVLLVRIAGRRRCEPAIELIANQLVADDDVMPSTAARALAEIGTDAVVTHLRNQFLHCMNDDRWQNFATDALKGIELASAEVALIEFLAPDLIDKYSDESTRSFVAMALVSLISEPSLPYLQQLVYEGYDEWLFELEDDVEAMAELFGRQICNSPEWTEAVTQRRQGRERRFEEFRSNLRSHRRADDFRIDDSLADDRDETFVEAPHFHEDTVIRNAQKVGRNDPCPCRSGKKYKKCCGAAVSSR